MNLMKITRVENYVVSLCSMSSENEVHFVVKSIVFPDLIERNCKLNISLKVNQEDVKKTRQTDVLYKSGLPLKSVSSFVQSYKAAQ